MVLTAEPMCSVRVIVRFFAAPTTAALVDIERTNALELAALETIADDLRVYLLSTPGLAADCRAAVERLQNDERVRFVELDVRRAPHDAGSTSREEAR
jgi:hypothetical protein